MHLPEILPDATPDLSDTLYEVVDGQVLETPPMGAFECWLASVLQNAIQRFAEGRPPGRSVVEMLFLIDRAGNLQRRPDLAFVSFERWPRNQRVPRSAAWDVVPDLAVEIVSQTNRAGEVQGKILDYLRTGVRLVWVVYPGSEQVYVYESPTRVQILQRGDSLDGGAVIPGFQLPLATWFDEEADPEPMA